MSAGKRFALWLMSPGLTGFSRLAHFLWCIGGILMNLVFLPCLVWFGYCCWSRDLTWAVVAGLALAGCVLMASVTLVVSSKIMATESILAQLEGRDLDF